MCFDVSDFRLQTTLPYSNGNPRHERPIWIWDRETAGFVWANGEGVKFWSAQSLEDLQARTFDKDHPAWLKVCQVFDGQIFDGQVLGDQMLDGYAPSFSNEKMGGLTPHNNAIGMSLYFPHKNGGAVAHQSTQGGTAHIALPSLRKNDAASNEGYFVALCRRSHLNNRTTLIVEVVAQSDRSKESTKEEAGEIVSPTLPEEETHELVASSVEGQTDTEDKDLILGAQLKKLARLIEEAGGSEQDILTATSLHETETLSAPKSAPKPQEPLDIDEITSPSDQISQPKWAPNEVDLIALSGVGDQDELEALFENLDEAYALVSLQKIIHANDNFVSEFGYSKIDPLINDGCDWLFPKSREIFTALLNSELGTPNEGSSAGLRQVRLRSGRKLERDVLITPVKLTKFDRVLLLLQLSKTFEGAPLTKGAIPPSDQTAFHKSIEVDTSGPSIPLLSAISHEVRTPLNVILGFSEIMALQQFGPLGHEKYMDYAQDIHKSAEHALSLINDLLDLTKLKAGKWDVTPHEVDLNKVVRQQVHLMRELAAKEAVRLRSDLEENLPLVQADERSLLQIMLNLISNGIKYASEGGLITVQTRLTNERHVLLSVSDTGPGMSQGEIHQAMEPFHQVSQGSEEISSLSLNPAYIGAGGQKKGTGLGLPISKALAEANDIEFVIDSQKNKGTTIHLTFSLP